jgi:multicomponent Na+:H+ antiporter subunit E
MRKKVIDSLPMILCLTLIWCGFSGEVVTSTVLSGIFVAIFCHALFRSKDTRAIRFRIIPFFLLACFTIKELIISSILVAQEIVVPRVLSTPEILELPLSCHDSTQILLLTNLISLTPGTLVIDVIDNKAVRFHAMFATDKEKMISFIKDVLEPKVMRVFSYE